MICKAPTQNDQKEMQSRKRIVTKTHEMTADGRRSTHNTTAAMGQLLQRFTCVSTGVPYVMQVATVDRLTSFPSHQS